MKYKICSRGIKVFDKEQFNPQHILECGQVFCFEKTEEGYIVYPQDKFAKIVEKKDCYVIETKDIEFFVEYFDLNRNYLAIKKELAKYPLLQNALNFGYGIRILKQNPIETIISFIISANNNIKRIKLILNGIRKALGSPLCNGAYSFPDMRQLFSCGEDFFKKLGAGYRASYLVKTISQLQNVDFDEWCKLSTAELRKALITLSGVGPKVADCILLFGFARMDVFPVDTWINQMYNMHYAPLSNREKIRNNLTLEYGRLSGFAQQYLFYYQRSFKDKN